MDIENKFLKETLPLEFLTKYYGMGNQLVLDEIGKRLIVKELTTLTKSPGGAGAFLALFQDEMDSWFEMLRFLVGRFKPSVAFGFTLQHSERAIISTCSIEEDDNIHYSRKYGYLGPLNPGETEESIKEGVVSRLFGQGQRIDIVKFDDVDGSLQTEDIVGDVKNHFAELLSKTQNSYCFTNSPGGGAVVTESFNKIVVKEGHSFLIIDRINYEPSKVTLVVAESNTGNVVALQA